MIRADIFAVTPAQITRLDDKGLVELLGRLLHAEARACGLPLSGVHMPVQITVPDGGEDGRMVWEGGVDRTDYLPHRHTALQAKATAVTAASLKSETLVLSTAKRRSKATKTSPVLRPVLVEAIAASGAYIVATTKALNAKQKKPLIAAIREGIAATGNAPRALTIDIYDANKLAAWATHHQAVALALNEKLGDHSLSGFKSLDMWSRRDDFHSIPWADDDLARFALAPALLPTSDRKDKSRNAWTFAQTRSAVLGHIAEHQRAVRIFGASGLGKSRLSNALFRGDGAVTTRVQAASVIYADHSVVGDAVLQLAHRYADTGIDAVLVVDECSDRTHQRLLEAVTQQSSRLRMISIDVENRQVASSTVITVEVEAASTGLIETIVGSVDSKLDHTIKSYVRDVAQGFPRMAVHGARAASEGANPIRSAAELIDRIVWGRRTPDTEAMRALEVASLFDALRIKGDDPTDLSVIAPLAEMSDARMREHLLSFSERGIVVEKGRFAQVQPIPLAAQLGQRRLMSLGATGIAMFFADAPDHLKSRLLDRLKWLDTSDEAKSFAADLLSVDGIGSVAVLNTELGARCFDRLVHLVPDLAMNVLDRELSAHTIDELKQFKEGRRHIVWAIEKLVFRHQTFDRAARLLLRLAAAETEPSIGNNATGEFKRLFQRELSGTEAEPAARLAVLDDGLASTDPVTRQICVEAAGTMLDNGHFSRSGGAEVIGSQAPLKDWSPKTYGEIWDFHCAGLDRLAIVALGDSSDAATAQKLIGTHIRSLLFTVPFDRVEPTLKRVATRVGVWRDAIRSVSEWLYFDRRKDSDAEQSAKVRQLYDELMPANVVDRALLFSSGWTSDIHDPDLDYNDKATGSNDHYYSDRMVEQLGERIGAEGGESLQRVLVAGIDQTLHSGHLLGRAIARAVQSPPDAFRSLVSIADKNGALPDDRFVRGFLNGLEAVDPALARACVDEALSSSVLGQHATAMMQALSLTTADIPKLVDLLRAGRIKPDWCAHLSYGQGFANLTPDALAPFLDALVETGIEGCWSALEIISMVLHGTQGLPPDYADRLKAILIREDLFEAATRKTRDAHLVNSKVNRLAANGGIDEAFARSFVRQLLRITDLDHHLRFDFEHYSDEMFSCLIAKAPDAVWSEVAQRLVSDNGIQKLRLDRLLAPSRDDRSGPGILFTLPSRLYLEWAREAPGMRARAVAQWIPLTEKDAAGNRVWHPALETFVDEFAGADGVLPTIGSRLRPSGWSGSLVPYLEPWLPLVEDWRKHKHAEVRRWATTAHQGLMQQISDELKEDAERDVGIW